MNNKIKRKALYIAMLVAVSQPALSSVNYNLPSDEWRMISLPSDPGNQNTVKEIFGDDILAEYLKDWVVYSYNAEINKYEIKTLYDRLKPGEGYWIIQKSGHPVQLNMPENSVTDSTKIPLVSSNGKYIQWHLVGVPLSVPIKVSDLRVITQSGDCINDGCDINKAEENKIFHHKLWRYSRDGSAQYETISGNDTLNPWDVFWCATLKDAFTMGPVNLTTGDTSIRNAPPIDGEWEMTFKDDFNGTALDPDKWRIGSHHMGIIGEAGNSPEQIKVENGKLELTAEKAPDGFRFSGKPYDYKTGEISTFKKFKQKKGYYEARIKYAVKKGVWPAFWMMPDRGDYGPDRNKSMSYLKFKIDQTKNMISSATLKIKVKELSDPNEGNAGDKNFNLSVHKLLSEDWGEDRIAWKDSPKYDPLWLKQFNNSTTGKGDMKQGEDIEIDVTDYINDQIQGNKTFAGFALVDTFMKDKKITFYSMESANFSDKPRLIIDGKTYTPSADTDTIGKGKKKTELVVRQPYRKTSSTFGGGMEIDIMETLGSFEGEIQHALHWDYSSGRDYKNRKTKEFKQPKLNDGYHVYGMLWEDDRIEFYIDGKKSDAYHKGDFYRIGSKNYNTGDSIPTVASYILLSHQLGGWPNSGNGVPSGFSSSTMSVDYVHVWKKK